MSTLRQVLNELEGWLRNPVSDCEALVEDIETVLVSIGPARAAVERELAGNTSVSEFAALLSGSAAAYSDLEQTLTQILSSVAAGDTELAQEEVVYLKAGTATLRHYTEALEEWLAEPLMRCPRCGSGEAQAGEEAVCSGCDLELLYPDLHPDTQASRQIVRLGGEFHTVFRTYVAVLSGECPLHRLGEPLQQLISWLEERKKLSTQAPDPAVRGQLEEVRSLCDQAIRGAQTMAECFESREAGHLNAGWRDVFNAAEQLQRSLPELLVRFGVEVKRIDSGTDTVQFSGED